MRRLLHWNLHYRENNILLWAKTQIWEIFFLSQVNYFWWKASHHFATGVQLYTQNIMHVHRERALLGVSILMMPSSVPSFPEKLFMESQDTDSEMEKQNKTKPNNHQKCQHRKASWWGKRQLHSIYLSCFRRRKQWGHTAIISLPDGKQRAHSVVWSCWQDVAGFSSQTHRHTGRQTNPPNCSWRAPSCHLGQTDRQTESTTPARLCVLTARSTRSAGCPHCLCSLQDLAKVEPVTGEPSFPVQGWHCC